MRKLIRFCLTFLVSIAVVLSLILCLNSGALMRLFVQDAGMIATGAQMLRWQVYTAAFGGVVLLLTVLFQATGKIRTVLPALHQAVRAVVFSVGTGGLRTSVPVSGPC